jgi:hypothetical protein
VAVEKWIGGSGVGLTWTNAFTGSTLNSIASGNAILSDLQIDNSSALDIFADVSIALASAFFVSPNFIGVYLYPLNQDGTTYGDGRFGASAAGPPASTYWVGNIVIVAATSVQEGMVRGIIMPPGKFKFLLYNQGGVAFSSSGNVCLYRTYNRSVA